MTVAWLEKLRDKKWNTNRARGTLKITILSENSAFHAGLIQSVPLALEKNAKGATCSSPKCNLRLQKSNTDPRALKRQLKPHYIKNRLLLPHHIKQIQALSGIIYQRKILMGDIDYRASLLFVQLISVHPVENLIRHSQD